MLNEAPITMATPALGSINLNKMVQSNSEAPANAQPPTTNSRCPIARIALLTGGGDKPYALGMAAALTSAGMHVDFIGSDDLKVSDLLSNARVNFLNLRGDQREDASPVEKVLRVLKYY